MSKENDSIRKQVSEFYARSVNQGCGCGCNCGPTMPTGVAAKQAGYEDGELQQLPEDAVQSSFGCGNPLAFSDVQEGQIVLDLGSGAGIDLLIAADKVGKAGNVIGVDMTDDMIARARANISEAGYDNVEVRKGIIEQLPVDDNSVDWVISNCVINLSPEKEKVFAEIARVLKPGGRISISDIVTENLPSWARESAALYGSCVAGAISEQDYLSGLKQAGLASAEVTERIVYTGAQLEAFVESEVPQEGTSCCGGGNTKELMVKGMASALEGKLWSAKFVGQKTND